MPIRLCLSKTITTDPKNLVTDYSLTQFHSLKGPRVVSLPEALSKGTETPLGPDARGLNGKETSKMAAIHALPMSYGDNGTEVSTYTRVNLVAIIWGLFEDFRQMAVLVCYLETTVGFLTHPSLCFLCRCHDCGAILEEYDEETLGLAIVVLSTFIHLSPDLAAPLLLDIMQSVGR